MNKLQIIIAAIALALATSTTPVQADVDKLAALEAEKAALRAELAGLSAGSEGAE